MAEEQRNHDALDDTRLAQLAQGGDLVAFEQLIRRYQGRLFCFLRYYHANQHDIEDAVQETFLTLHRKISQYDDQYCFRSWLFTIARRRLVRHQQKFTRANEVLDEESVTESPPDSYLTAAETRDSLWASIRTRTSDEEFELLWYHYAERIPLTEISRVLSRSHDWCKQTLSRTRRRLQAHLERFLGCHELSGDCQK